jgi:hydroxypyruvate isomerase
VALRWSAHISWLFRELPYLERVGAARRAGFGVIETAWPEPEERRGLAAALAEHGMEAALLNCNAGDVEAGERGFAGDPARREELERDFLAAAELASAIGAPSVNLLLGRELPGLGAAAQRHALVAALCELAPQAAARGLRILLEPLNAVENPGYLAPTPRAVVELIEQCGSDALALLFDVYHVARGGGDPLEEAARFAGFIGHVQVSDYPGRGQPGSGALALWSILERLDERGYRGSVGLEYEPRGRGGRSFAFLSDERSVVRL